MQQEYVGVGSLQRITQILEQEKPPTIMLVRGKKSYEQSGAAAILAPALHSYKVTEWDNFSNNPQWPEVLQGIKQWHDTKPALVIAVGGGSCIDVAKMVTILAQQPGQPEQYLEKKQSLVRRTTPFVAIPTTSGTGSESTHFATVYKDKEKYSLAHPSLLPDYVIIDPNLTLSLPPYVTACTGMDALSQAIESYWSVHSTKESKEYAARAITLALEHLETVVKQPDNIKARLSMARAANLAGKAINISFTTACHAISYPITSYFKVPHGHAVALSLPQMVIFNAGVTVTDCADRRGAAYVKEIIDQLCLFFGVSTANDVKKRVESIMDRIGLERTLSKVGVRSSQDIELIIRNGLSPQRAGNNPRQITPQELERMLLKIK